MRRNAADGYVSALRNAHKREYAQRYLAWRRGAIGYDLPGGPDDPQGPRGRLSYMAAQAVRMNIDGFFEANELRESNE